MTQIHCQLNDVESAAANVVRAIEHWMAGNRLTLNLKTQLFT